MTTLYNTDGRVVAIYDTTGRLVWGGTPPEPAPGPTPPTGPARNIATRMAQMGGGQSIGAGRLVATTHLITVDTLAPTLAWDFSTNGMGGYSSDLESTARVWVSRGTGTPAPVHFGGMTEVVFPANEGMPATIISDPIPLDLYAGEVLHVWVESTPIGTGKVATSATQYVPGTDRGWVQGGTINDPLAGVGTSPAMRPSRVIAPSDLPAWVLAGDSITQATDTYSEMWAASAGLAAVKSGRFGDSYNGQRPGTDRFPGQIAPHLPYATHLLDCYGINDNGTGLAIPTVAHRWWGQILAAAPDTRIVKTTLLPVSTSTDGWQTLAGQTATRTDRVHFNQWLRDGAPLVDGVPVAVGTVGADRCPVAQNGVIIQAAEGAGHPLAGVTDIADAVESSQDSGLWKTGWPTSAYQDGLHPLGGGPIMQTLANRLTTDLGALGV